MTDLAQALSDSLLHFVWEGALAGFLCAAVLALLRRRSANARYLAACGGLALMAAIPAIDTVAALRRADAPARSAVMLRSTAAPPTAPSPATAIDAAGGWTLRIWAAGVLLLALRLAFSYGQAARLRRSGEAAAADLLARAADLAGRMGVLQPVSILISRVADCPSVTGWLRPAILLPAAVLAGLDAEQLEAILAHELAHIRRHDYLVNLLQTVVETLLFYHPAVWWLSARIRCERECCCDDIAVRYTGGALPYARALASLERLRTAPALMPAANGSPLLFRIRRLTGEVDTAPSRLPAVAAAVVGVLCLALNVHWARGQSRETAGVLSRAPLAYPESARARGIEGTVVAEVTLAGEGNVTDARIVSGPYELRKAALTSVLDWRFANAAPGEVRQVPIDFRKDMASTESVAGVLGLADGLNERLMHLAEQRTQLEGTIQELQQQRARAESASKDAQQQRDRVAELRAEMQAVEAQLAEEQQRLSQAEQSGRRSSALNAPEEQIAAQLRDLEALRAEMAQKYGRNNPQMKDVQSEIETVQGRLAELRRGQSRELSVRSSAATDVGRQIEILRAQLTDMQTTYGPNNPRMKEVQSQIALLQSRLAELDVTPDMTGHRIGSVRALGAGDAPVPDCPIRAGDEWTAQSRAQLEAWARSKGAQLSYRFTIDDGGVIDLVIRLK